jgi:hypothetical protein
MVQLRIEIDDRLMTLITTVAKKLWPGEDGRSVMRLVKDALRRYLRYANVDSRRRNSR